MADKTIKVNMFGEFCIAYNGLEIKYSDSRSKMPWRLLAFLFFNLGHPVTPYDIIHTIWEDEFSVSNPQNAVKTLVHRSRSLLDSLEDSLGRRLLVNKDNKYFINTTDYELICDVFEFEKSFNEAASSQNEQEETTLLSNAVQLYSGDLLPMFSSEFQFIPRVSYYHNLYSKCVSELLQNYTLNNDCDQIISLCRNALLIEPYNESFYLKLLEALQFKGDKSGIITTYEKLSSTLSQNFGTIPSDEATEIYRKASHVAVGTSIKIDDLTSSLQEKPSNRGAMFCDYDMFKFVYHAIARQLQRSGDVYHIGMLSLRGKKDDISKKSMDKASDDFREFILSTLRIGDIATKCSATQFLIMFPQANYENSCKACTRVISAYYKKYPHSPVDISYYVIPLEPNLFN